METRQARNNRVTNQPAVFRYSAEDLAILLSERLRGQADGRVIWVDGDSEVVVYPHALQLAIHPKLLLIELIMETDQSRHGSLIISLSMGDSPNLATLFAITEDLPRGNALLASRWGKIAQDVVWNLILDIGQTTIDTHVQDRTLNISGLYIDDGQIAYLASPPIVAEDITAYFDALRKASDGDLPTDFDPQPEELFPDVPLPSIRRFMLIDATTGKTVDGYEALQDGDTLDLRHLPLDHISIEIEPTNQQVASVRIDINPGDQQQIQNERPYTLMGEEGDIAQRIQPWTPKLGSYLISATPFADADGQGEAGITKQIRLNILRTPKMQVRNFSLVDARNGEIIIEQLQDDMTINLTELPTKQLTIIAQTDPVEVGSVVFGLNNNPTFRVENIVPYTLLGDRGNQFKAWTPLGKNYLIQATPYSESYGRGHVGETAEIRLKFINKQDISITSFSLIDAEQDCPISDFDPIPNNTTIDLRLLPTRNLSIVANTHPQDIGSVQFELNGKTFRTENVRPYALFGDRNGNFLGSAFDLDKYRICATPYRKANAKGKAGDTLKLNFTVIDTTPQISVVSFSLIDAAKNCAIPAYDPITNGSKISLASLRRNHFNIRANTLGDGVASVVFKLNNKTFDPNNDPPFSLFGEKPNKYQGEKLVPMVYFLTATPFSKRNGEGFSGIPATVRFRLTNKQGGDL